MARRQEGLRWETVHGGCIPAGAIEIGRHGHNAETMFVGRATINGDLVPGKVVPSHGVCYVGCNNVEKGEHCYEALVNPSGRSVLVWVPALNGQVPSGAIEAGRVASTGEPLFIGRGHPQPDPYGTHGGKVHPSHGCCYIPVRFFLKITPISYHKTCCGTVQWYRACS